jgi:hypothetical protein
MHERSWQHARLAMKYRGKNLVLRRYSTGET